MALAESSPDRELRSWFGRDVGEPWREAAGWELGTLESFPQVLSGGAEGFGEEAIGLFERLARLAGGGVDYRAWSPLGAVGCVVGMDLLNGLASQGSAQQGASLFSGGGWGGAP